MIKNILIFFAFNLFVGLLYAIWRVLKLRNNIRRKEAFFDYYNSKDFKKNKIKMIFSIVLLLIYIYLSNLIAFKFEINYLLKNIVFSLPLIISSFLLFMHLKYFDLIGDKIFFCILHLNILLLCIAGFQEDVQSNFGFIYLFMVPAWTVYITNAFIFQKGFRNYYK